jgi:5-methylcytosine-specific restriction endonuclease McrA
MPSKSPVKRLESWRKYNAQRVVDWVVYHCPACDMDRTVKWRSPRPRGGDRLCKGCSRRIDKSVVLTSAQKQARYRASHPEYVNWWHRENPDKVRASAQRYRERNPDKVRERQQILNKLNRIDPVRRERLRKQKQADYQRHKSKYDAVHKAWNERNRDRALFTKRLRERRRVFRKSKILGTCTWSQWLARVAFYGWRCVYCYIKLTPETVGMDHRIPISRGGSNWPANLASCCASCNSSKSNKTPSEFFNWRKVKWQLAKSV